LAGALAAAAFLAGAAGFLAASFFGAAFFAAGAFFAGVDFEVVDFLAVAILETPPFGPQQRITKSVRVKYHYSGRDAVFKLRVKVNAFVTVGPQFFRFVRKICGHAVRNSTINSPNSTRAE
jgi:hypothetical protein